MKQETAREWAEKEIARDMANREELIEERREAWRRGDRRTYDALTRDIQELYIGIKALREAYGVEE